MYLSLRLPSLRVLGIAALLALGAIAAFIGIALRPAGAVSSGPTIDMSASTTLIQNLGDPVTLTFASTGTTSAAYKGYQVKVTYDSSKMQIDSNGPADLARPELFADDSCESAWDQPLSGSTRYAVIRCVSTTGGTSAVGDLASALFTAIAPGAAVFTLQPNPADTYTIEDADGSAQTNALTCEGASQGATCTVVVNIMPPDLAVDISASDPQPLDGATETLTVNLTNLSATTTATDVELIVELPDGLDPQTLPGGCTATSNPGANTVTCTLGNIGPGAYPPIVIGTLANWTGVTAATVLVEADVTLFEADPVTANNHDEVTINNGAGIDLSATAVRQLYTHATYGSDVVAGDIIRYAVTVTNPSATLATGVTADLTFQAGLVPWRALGADSCTITAQTISCRINNLAANTNRVVTYWGSVHYTAPPANVPPLCTAPAGTSVTGDRPDSNDANDHPCDDGVTLPIAADADGDGFSDAEETAAGESPTSYCAIMRGDVNHDGVTAVTDISLIALGQGTVPPMPGILQQLDLLSSDGTLGADLSVSQADIDMLSQRFFGKAVSLCRN